jgi:hypothetical protein
MTDCFVEPSSIIHLLHELITAASLNKQSNGPHTNDRGSLDAPQQSSIEEAGCMLWDLASADDCAKVMLQNNALIIIDGLIKQRVAGYQPPRTAEICLGILGNILAHGSTVADYASAEDIDAVAHTSVNDLLLPLEDAPALSECCRALNMAMLAKVGLLRHLLRQHTVLVFNHRGV